MEAAATQQGTDWQPDGPADDSVPGTPRAAAAEARQAAAAEAFARDHDGLTLDDEVDALDFILSGKPPAVHTVPLTIVTDTGHSRLEWDFKAQDARLIREIEDRNTNESTGVIDTVTNDAQLLAEATVELRTPRRTIDIRSTEFRTIRARKAGSDEYEEITLSPPDALEARFKKQWGLAANVANEVRKLSGYDKTKVGASHRKLVTASGN